MAKPRHRSAMHPDLPEKPGGPDNWVEKVGGLPNFIKRVAKHIFYDSPGMTVSHAIAAAIEQVKKWAAKGNAKAIAALAQWEGKKAASHALEDDELSAVELFDLALLQQRRDVRYSMAGNAPSAGTGAVVVRGAKFNEAKHNRTSGGQFTNKISEGDLIVARRQVEGALTRLRVGQSYNLPGKVGWVKRTPGGFFVQGNGGFTASVRTLSEAVQAAARLLAMKGVKK